MAAVLQVPCLTSWYKEVGIMVIGRKLNALVHLKHFPQPGSRNASDLIITPLDGG